MLVKPTALFFLAASTSVSANLRSRSLTRCPSVSDANGDKGTCKLCVIKNREVTECMDLSPDKVNTYEPPEDGCLNVICEPAGYDVCKVDDSDDKVDYVKFEYDGKIWQENRCEYWMGGNNSGGPFCVDYLKDCGEKEFHATYAYPVFEPTKSVDCFKDTYKLTCGKEPPSPSPTPGPTPPPTPGPTPSPTPGPTSSPTPCPKIEYPHIKECKMKKGLLKIKFEEKCQRLDPHYKFIFESSTKDPYWKYEQYHVEDGIYEDDYDEADSKDGCKGEEYFIEVKTMNDETLNKKVEEKPFFGYLTDKNGCVSKPFQCENKNLTPLGIDLDNSGLIETVRGDFHIDLDGDHFPETLEEWFAPTEGILLDVSSGLENGVNADHLFGDDGGHYENGFDKLAALDVNGDETVSGSELANVAVWVDANSNAILDAGELKSLDDFGIVSLSVVQSHLVSTATLADGSTMKVEDLYFSRHEPEAIV